MEMSAAIYLIIITSITSFAFGMYFAKQRIEYVAQRGMLSYMDFLKRQIGQEEYNRINREYLEAIGIRTIGEDRN